TAGETLTQVFAAAAHDETARSPEDATARALLNALNAPTSGRQYREAAECLASRSFRYSIWEDDFITKAASIIADDLTGSNVSRRLHAVNALTLGEVRQMVLTPSHYEHLLRLVDEDLNLDEAA